MNGASAGSATICARGIITSPTVRSDTAMRAFHHPQRVGRDQAVGLRVAQQLDQVFAGGGFAGKRGG